MASSLCAGFFFFLYLPTFLKHTLKVSKLLSRMHEEWCSLPMVPKALKKKSDTKSNWSRVVPGPGRTKKNHPSLDGFYSVLVPHSCSLLSRW